MFFILRFAALPESSWLHEDGSLGGLFTTLHFILLSSALFDFTCIFYSGLPWWLSGKEFTFQRSRRGFSPWVGKIPWRRKWQPIPVFLAGKSHGQRSLVGYTPAAAAAAAKLLQSCPTLYDPRDGSPRGSAVPGILQARTLERVAIFFSNA